MSDSSSPIWITFIRVLARLDWAHRLGPPDYSTQQVNAVESLDEYLRTMNLGVTYERYVQSVENRSNPHCLTRENFSNARRLRSQGWSFDSVADLIDYEWPQLSDIPQDADLFVTDEYDDAMIEVLDEMCATPGIQPANATKLLYQKRPALVPILDQYARQALSIGWVKDNREFFCYAIKRVREFNARNLNGLAQAESWLNSNPHVAAGLTLSRVRIVDILAWYLKARDKYQPAYQEIEIP